MALPDYFKIEPGTAVIWGEASATGGWGTVTKTLSLNALANGSGRMGDYVDLGAQFDEEYAAYLIVETGTAPTAGNTAQLYLAYSYISTKFPGKVTGSDAAYPTTVLDNLKQLGAPSVILVATADGNTELAQGPSIVRPQGRYVAPVVYNALGQAFRNQGTAANNLSRVILVPRRYLIQDTA